MGEKAKAANLIGEGMSRKTTARPPGQPFSQSTRNLSRENNIRYKRLRMYMQAPRQGTVSVTRAMLLGY